MNTLQLEFPTARKDDPETSKKAGRKLKIRAGTQQWLLLKAYSANLSGMTDEEAGVFTGLDKFRRCCYWKRCSELRQAGYIAPTGEERESTANRMQRVCVITDLGRDVLR